MLGNELDITSAPEVSQEFILTFKYGIETVFYRLVQGAACEGIKLGRGGCRGRCDRR